MENVKERVHNIKGDGLGLEKEGGVVTETKEEVKEELVKEELKLSSTGIIYTGEEVLWHSVGADVGEFKRYQQEYAKAYNVLATELRQTLGADVEVLRYGLYITVGGQDYLFSKDYLTGSHLIEGSNTAIAQYILSHKKLDKLRIKGRYLTKKQRESARQVVIEKYIILPTKQEILLRDSLETLSLNRPKDWIEAMVNITTSLGLDEPKIEMEKVDIVVYYTKRHKERISWKFDVESVKVLLTKMCGIWKHDKRSNRKPNNEVVRGGRTALVKYTPEQQEYRSYIEKQVEDAVEKSNLIMNHYDIKFSNTTTSCYITLSDIQIPELKVTIRDHERIHEKDYYRFYIDAVGREDFSDRLAKVLNRLIKDNKQN